MLIEHINKSKSDMESLDPQLKKLQQKNDLVIAFATLSYAWSRTATFYVLASKNKQWKFYFYQSKLPFSRIDTTSVLSSINISETDAENIKQLYTSSNLWETEGDENGVFCSDKKDCNINDAETWAISVATPKNIHTTTYYAPEFFEQCCPGNLRRQRFVAIAKEIMELSKNQNAQ